MGIASAMGQNMKKNMEAQMDFQKQLIVKQRQTQMAMQVAMGRIRLDYFGYLIMIATPFMLLGAIKKKNPALLGPTIPLGIAYAYQYDMVYGDMFQRAQKIADKLLTEEANKFYFPKNAGIVTLQEYQNILNIKDGKKKI